MPVGGILKPVIPVVFVHRDNPDKMVMYGTLVDSGADFTTISQTLAEELHLELPGDTVTTTGIGGETRVKPTMGRIILTMRAEAYQLEVPINVVMPPSMDANASGIKIRPGGIFSLDAICSAIGINSANAPTLFIKPERIAAKPAKAAIDNTGPASAGIIQRVSPSTAPEFCSPALKIRMHATVMTAG